MLEQEIASVIKFTLDRANNPSPYYYKVPQSFAVPSAYFPTPEIETRGETFSTYAMSYTWFIKFFHKTTQASYDMALLVLLALKSNRNLVPLIDIEGNPTGKSIRIKDPTLATVEDGTVQLKISWDSRRPYDSEAVLKMQRYYIDGWSNPDIYRERIITTAFESALERYVTDYPTAEKDGEYPNKK
ncbi:MAG: hypothetical protein RR162_00270 [Oscillospiraceae bacterium]